jgi:HlyD family secretion protein
VKRLLGAALLLAVAACTKKQQTPSVQTAVVTRRDIIIDAQANGVIEPIAIIEVKSKASGVITKMPVETGTKVNPGDLIVQIDTRDVQNRFDQMNAALDAAEARLSVAESDRKRNEDLFKARVITPQEYENTAVTYETAKTNIIKAKADLDLAKQALEEATVKAPAEGTIIEKTVAVGTVVAGATSSVSGGTTIVKMADLDVVRVRALFNESDIGNIHPGQPANVTVDAYPDRRFAGVVEKIEPQAVVQQNVTMFPVLVNLENTEALLKPGMNGMINVLIDEHDGVIAVPNDAIKNPREAVATGAMLGLSADSVTKEMTAQGFNMTGNRGGFAPGAGGRRGNRGGAGGGGTGGGGNGPGNGAASAASSGTTSSSSGEVAVVEQQGQGGGGQGFGGQQVSDEDCKKIDAILKAHPKEKKQLDELVAKMTALRPAGFGGRGGNGGGGGGGGGGGFGNGDNRRSMQGGGGGGGGGDSTQRRRGGGAGAGRDSSQRGGGRGRGMSPEMQAISDQMRTIYTALNIDQRTAGGCRRRQMGQASANANASGARQPGNATQGGRGGQLSQPNELSQRPQRARQGLVFVSDSAKTSFHPRIVRLGQGNLDFTEVVEGLKEGERVVMLGALALQAQRLQQQDRARQNASPLGGQGGPGGGPGGGGPGGGGGGGGGRGGRGG